jgi:hypothetical protein
VRAGRKLAESIHATRGSPSPGVATTTAPAGLDGSSRTRSRPQTDCARRQHHSMRWNTQQTSGGAAPVNQVHTYDYRTFNSEGNPTSHDWIAGSVPQCGGLSSTSCVRLSRPAVLDVKLRSARSSGQWLAETAWNHALSWSSSNPCALWHPAHFQADLPPGESRREGQRKEQPRRRTQSHARVDGVN